MNPRVLKACAAVAALALTFFSQADSVDLTPITVPSDNTTITIQFLGASADYTGEFSFLGAGTVSQITLPATDTGLPGLGQHLFANHDGATDAIQLQGTYNTGDVLHFGYNIVQPLDVIDLLRTDVPNDTSQFDWDSESGQLTIEDLRQTNDFYDGDFNDNVVRITFSSVPTPGTAFLAVLGFLVAIRGRRRTA